ncbi:hypothetical protein ACJ4V0_19865 [Phreatobacter sp. HK31-P]|nr:hypothetical protein [Phreatobacter sp.]
MRHSAFRTLALSTALGALALGATVLMPSSASATPMVDRAAINAALGGGIDTSQPVEMQRRGGFRGGGGGVRGGPRGGFRGGRGGGRGFGPGAALGLGAAALIIGGAAAAASAGPRECWIERRWVEGPYGPERRRIRVCE